MVLDYLVLPHQAKRDPWELMIVAFLFVSFGVLVEYLLPTIRGSIIVFTMVPAIPLLWNLIVKEEMDEEEDIEAAARMHKGPRIFHAHAAMWEVLAFFFLGAVIAYSFWYAALPQEASQRFFADQISELKNIRGSFAAVTGQAFNEGQFMFLLTHNLQVLGIMFLFCLIYGMGSLYMLLWNASIIGVVIGGKLQTLGPIGAVTGFLGLLPHGIFEIGAYFVATIAGGLFSVAVMRGAKNRGFKYVLADVVILTIVSVILLTIGAFIEASY